MTQIDRKEEAIAARLVLSVELRTWHSLLCIATVYVLPLEDGANEIGIVIDPHPELSKMTWLVTTPVATIACLSIVYTRLKR